MKLYCVVAVAVIVLALCAQTESQSAKGPDECCFSLYTRPIPPRAIKEYKITHAKCDRKAVILITVKDKKLCANPENKNVQNIMDRLDNLFGIPSPIGSS